MKKTLILLVGFFSLSFAHSQWCEQNSGTNSISCIFFTDTLNGWFIGHGPLIIKNTVDGGSSWQNKSTPDSVSLTQLHFINPETGWAVGYISHPYSSNKGVIYHTDNAGNDWELLDSLTPDFCDLSEYEDVFFLDSLTGWVVGNCVPTEPTYDCGLIVRTIDGGATWQMSTVDGLRPISVFFINPNKGWIAGDFDDIYHTMDGGITWEEEVTPDLTYWYRLQGIFFTDEQHGWAVGNGFEYDEGVILKYTLDFGWEVVRTGTGYKSVHFTDSLSGWVGSTGILHTSDGGYNWEWEIYDSLAYNLYHMYSIHFPSQEQGWAASARTGQIFHTCFANLNPENTINPLKVYPNPASTFVTWEYQVTNEGKSTLQIFNKLGYMVDCSLNEFQHYGQHAITIDTKGLSPGIYFYRLTTIPAHSYTSGQTATGKFIIVR
jgi:photosystem II stability/assembly factor-like uncharacterized protein